MDEGERDEMGTWCHGAISRRAKGSEMCQPLKAAVILRWMVSKRGSIM